MCANFWIIVKHLLLDIVIPTLDILSDYTFVCEAFSTENYGIGSMMLTPVILNVIFNIYSWATMDFDGEKEKYFSWIAVPFWHQYQTGKLLVSICKNRTEASWKDRQEKIKNQISFTEPFIEAVPQFFISSCIYGILLTRDSGGANSAHARSVCTFFTSIWSEETSQVIEVFGKTTIGLPNQNEEPQPRKK